MGWIKAVKNNSCPHHIHMLRRQLHDRGAVGTMKNLHRNSPFLNAVNHPVKLFDLMSHMGFIPHIRAGKMGEHPLDPKILQPMNFLNLSQTSSPGRKPIRLMPVSIFICISQSFRLPPLPHQTPLPYQSCILSGLYPTPPFPDTDPHNCIREPGSVF